MPAPPAIWRLSGLDRNCLSAITHLPQSRHASSRSRAVPEGTHSVTEVHEQTARLLGSPRTSRVGGHAEDVHPPGLAAEPGSAARAEVLGVMARGTPRIPGRQCECRRGDDAFKAVRLGCCTVVIYLHSRPQTVGNFARRSAGCPMLSATLRETLLCCGVATGHQAWAVTAGSCCAAGRRLPL
jgi:hypothetical protein